MEKFKGTGGSWSSNGLYIKSDNEHFPLGQAFVRVQWEHGKQKVDIEGNSNASLMAAAPDLLEALQEMLLCHENGVRAPFETANKAIDAINKALNQQ